VWVGGYQAPDMPGIYAQSYTEDMNVIYLASRIGTGEKLRCYCPSLNRNRSRKSDFLARCLSTTTYVVLTYPELQEMAALW